jgi:hypothetical protein
MPGLPGVVNVCVIGPREGIACDCAGGAEQNPITSANAVRRAAKGIKRYLFTGTS